MSERVILHLDINHCYAQIEEMLHPELSFVPMVVGGSEEKRHGIILAKNLLAKKYGIKTGEPLRDALKKCPGLTVIPVHFDEYIYYTSKVKDIYREYTDQVESFGLDEAWIDVTKSATIHGDGESVAKIIQQRVKEEIGLTISIGVSYNKIFAKLGSDMIKPNGLVVISRDNYKQVAWPLPVEDLLYVGHATHDKLARIGVKTIGDLATLPVGVMKDMIGKMGEIVWGFANGIDGSDVDLTTYSRQVKSVGNSITAVHDIKNLEEAKMVYHVLVESVASRLKDHGLKGYVISIGLRDKNFISFGRQRKVEIATNISDEIFKVVIELVKESYNFATPLRSIGVTVSGLEKDHAFTQLNLFVNEEERLALKRLDMIVDNIRARFGFEAVKRCSVIQDRALTNFDPKGDHTIHPVSYF
jgi:DNA polymerase-4